jgi:hypothetical protein
MTTPSQVEANIFDTWNDSTRGSAAWEIIRGAPVAWPPRWRHQRRLRRAEDHRPVIEGFGLSGYGVHSNDGEYVKLKTMVPRLYLSARIIMDVSQDKVK